jgi:flavodoxin
MKTAVVYYSYEGNCAAAAERIGAALGADILSLKTVDAKKHKGFIKFAWGGSQVFMRKKPPLKPYDFNPGAYDLIVIGCPVWAASPAPPLRTFLAQTPITGKNIALFCCHAGGMGKALEKLKGLLSGNTFSGEINFVNPAGQDKETLGRQIDEWVKTLKR